MDLDLDFSDDKIESFLTTKLEEIRLKNDSLEAILNQHKHSLKSCDIDSLGISFKVVEDELWKKTFNNKYAIGYVVETLCKKDYKDIRVFLTWNSQETLYYKIQTFSAIPVSEDCKNAKKCNFISNSVEKSWDIFKGRTYLVVVIDIPQYLYKLEYEILGYFACSVEGQNFSIPLPKVNISVKDSTINTSCVSQDSLFNILSIISCSNQSDLVMILPEEWTASLISTFEIHCALIHLKIMISCKLYFMANDISKLFNNILIVVHSHHENINTLFLNIYTTDNNQLYKFCHYLGSCIPNVVFFPLSYYESFLCKNALFSKELLEEFKKNMKQELECSHKFAQSSSYSIGSQQFDQFRSTLSTIESNTDQHFLKVSNMKY